MISVIVTSRVDGNINHNLNELVRSLAEHSRRPGDIELLVKFDNNDNLAREAEATLFNKKVPFWIKCAYGPRERGYIDIHHGYNQLLPMMNPTTKIVIAMADDFRAEPGWDSALRNVSEGATDYFIIHQRPHPIPKDQFLNKTGQARTAFNLENNMFEGEDLYIINEAPAWSKQLLDACGDICGGSGEVFPVSFTDAWTLCLEYVLWHQYEINITKFIPEIFINRKTCEVDQPSNERWSTDRKVNFDYIKSNPFRSIVGRQAKEIACRLKQTAKF
jgi:hypothetical protein